MLTARDLGIKEGLIPAFCEDAPISTYCEECAKENDEEEENED